MAQPFSVCVNFSDLCRICTASTAEMELRTAIFSVEGQNKNLLRKIAECLSLTVDEHDRLPKYICYQCEAHLEKIAEFRNLCKNSQAMLLNCLNKASSQSATGTALPKDKVTNTGQGFPSSSEITFSLQTGPSTAETNFCNSDLLNTILQATGLQPNTYTIKLDNKENRIHLQREQPVTPQVSQESQQATTDVLEKIFRSKPNLKVTPIPRKDKVQPKFQQQTNIAESSQTHPTETQLQQLLQLPTQLRQKPMQQFTLATPTSQASDNLMPSPSKKAKLNFVITSSPTSNASPPNQKQQFGTMPSMVSSPPKIQLQLPTMQGSTSSAALLSTLAPLLQQYPGFSVSASPAPTQTPTSTFLPITIKDENSDKQIVAHIDAKNFMLPTYQLQMNLEPQLTTVDGQPVMQLAPSTLQIIPQPLNNQNLQITATAALNAGSALSNSHPLSAAASANISAPQRSIQQRDNEALHRQQMRLPDNVQVTSQQIIKSGHVDNRTILTTNVSATTNANQSVKFCKPMPQRRPVQPLPDSATTLKQPSKKPLAPTGNCSTNGTPAPNALTLPKQLGNITLQRVTNKNSNIGAANAYKVIAPTQHQTATTSATTSTASTVAPKILNKSNVLVSRVISLDQFPIEPETAAAPRAPEAKQQKQQPLKLKTMPQKTVQQSKADSALQQSVRQRNPLVKTPATTQAEYAATNTPNDATKSQEKLPANAKKPPIPVNANKKGTLKIEFVSPATLPTVSAAPAGKVAKKKPNDLVGAKTTNASNPFSLKCERCERVFKKKENLNQHLKLHTGHRPYQCSISGCDKKFSRKEHLNRHLISHSGQKHFKCDVCKKPFSRKDNLNKHKKIHTDGVEENPCKYTCQKCNKSFATKEHYQQHLETHEKTTEAPTTKPDSHPTPSVNVQVKKTTPSNTKNPRAANQQPSHQQQSQRTQQQQLAKPQASQQRLLTPQRQPAQSRQSGPSQQQQQPNAQLPQNPQQQQPSTAMKTISTLSPNAASFQTAQPQLLTTQQQQLQPLPQIVHVQLPGLLADGSSMLSITQQHPASQNAAGSSTTVLNIPPHIANLVQSGQAQIVNASTGQVFNITK